eukprot:scaffold32558_cov48-Prasinocladus_malaysianus.AAC.1
MDLIIWHSLAGCYDHKRLRQIWHAFFMLAAQAFLIQPEQFAKTARIRFACSVTCSLLKGSKNKNCFEIIAQGEAQKQ